MQLHPFDGGRVLPFGPLALHNAEGLDDQLTVVAVDRHLPVDPEPGAGLLFLCVGTLDAL